MSNQDIDTKLTPTKKLTNKQKVFVEAYLRTLNGTLSAIEAGYSKKTAYSIASENLMKPEIRVEIEKRISEKIMSSNEVMLRLSNMAQASLLPFIRIDKDGFVYFNFSDPEAQNYFYLIKKIKTKRERRIEGRGENAEQWEGEWVEVELHDAQSALEKIGRYHGLFIDRTDITSGGKPVTITVKYEDKKPPE